ncbi:MAG: type I DNA topoisomerase [Bacteroidetes bacterium]|nr:type I DNA topoisomerase [Bacteroidota bacterium]
MEDNLVIVESPAKAKTIEKFLGKEYVVKSSFGHIRDLSKKKLGIDVENDYKPNYEVSPDKKKIVSELRKLTKNAKTVWIASDEDREGEAIAWHLFDELKLKKENTKRIVFHEITKKAILKSIENPRGINLEIVNAQQARRILDRLVGFELSPILWKKIKPSLSAGRVQSVAVRLLVEREREIIAFKNEAFYKLSALFNVSISDKTYEFKADLSKRFDKKKEVLEFLETSKSSTYKVADVIKKPTKKSPLAPFTTSTLQQEASRKFNFSVSQTMMVAQKLYESGKITYMRTDSVNLSDFALAASKDVIVSNYGDEYSKTRKFKTKSKSAQEAHEAIRPTSLDKMTAGGSDAEKKLYQLIWKRTIASQMSEAKFEKTNINIDISNSDYKFLTTGEVLKFDGFLKVYEISESNDNSKILLPPLSKNDVLDMNTVNAIQRFTHHPARYTEAALVKKLEELGIGRPSTYAPIISTVQKRGYALKENRDGEMREYNFVSLVNNNIIDEIKTETTGAEKSKLFPTDIGIVVNDFLVEYFKDILDFNFTASVEKEFDEIANGNLVWNKMIDKFYKPFHKKVEETLENSERKSGERKLGIDKASGKELLVRIGRYGPMAQIGKTDDEEKPRYAKLTREQHIETITLQEALDLFRLPRLVGEYEDKEVSVAIGRFGPYVKHDNKFFSLKKGVDDPYTVSKDRSIEIIEEKREYDRKKTIKVFDQEIPIKILNGRWGPYISYNKKNFKIPKNVEPESLSLEACLEIINAVAEPKKTKPKTNTKAKAKTKTKTKAKTKAKAKTKTKTKTSKKE